MDTITVLIDSVWTDIFRYNIVEVIYDKITQTCKFVERTS